MTCPKCGAETVPDQRFCRSCGAKLRTVTERLPEPTATSPAEGTAVIFDDEVQRRNRLVAWGFIMMFVGVAIGVVGKKLMHDEIVTVVGILMSLMGILVTSLPYLWPSSRQNLRATPASERKLQKQSQSPNQLTEGRVDYVPSITERTTDLLESSEVGRHKQKDA